MKLKTLDNKLFPGQLKAKKSCLYVYCITPSIRDRELQLRGIDGNEIRVIPFKDICAIVHNSPPLPYKSDSYKTVSGWVMAHHHIIEEVYRISGTVLPMAFNTIIEAGKKSAIENLFSWMEDNYDTLKTKIDFFRGKGEYGVQVFWNPGVFIKKLTVESTEIASMEKEIASKPRGLAYMYRRKLERLITRKMENIQRENFEKFYRALKPHVERVKIEKAKKSGDDSSMLMNLSCLLDKSGVVEFQTKLENINSLEGIHVRLVGPLPPYSFI